MHLGNANFLRRGTVDISRLKKKVLEQSDDAWAVNSVRQKTYAAHVDTQTIPLIFDGNYRHRNPTSLPKFEEFRAELDPLLAEVASRVGEPGYFIRVLLTRLRPGGHIARHADFGYSMHNCHRMHVPLVTSEGVEFMVGDEKVFMGEGELWEINNIREHEVHNRSDVRRIHIIMDFAQPIRGRKHLSYAADRVFLPIRMKVMRMITQSSRGPD